MDDPFWVAIRQGDVEEVAALLSSDAELATKLFQDGKVPLNAVVELLGTGTELHPSKLSEIVTLLLAAGADPNFEAAPLFETPLQVTLRQFLLLRADDRPAGLEVVSALIDFFADVNHADELGETPLFEAAVCGSEEACRLLLSHGACASVRNVNGQSPADLASDESVREIIQEAIEDGSDEVESCEERAAADEEQPTTSFFDFDELEGAEEKFADLKKNVSKAAAGSADKLAAESEKSPLRPGATVQISGLVSTPQHNGRLARVEEFLSERGRWAVVLENGEKLSLKPSNLQLVDDAAVTSASKERTSKLSLREQGNEHFKAGRYREARQFYTEALSTDPQNSSLLSNRAATNLMLRNWDEAFQDASTAVRSDPMNVKACERMARSLLLQNRLYPEALQFCQARMKGLMPKQRGSAEWRPFVTIAQRVPAHASALHQCEEILADAKKADFEMEAARIVHAVIEMQQLLNEAESKSPFAERLSFTKVRAQLFPRPGSSNQSAETREQWTKDALREMDVLIKDKPEWPDSHHWRARCLLRLTRRREAREALKEAMRIAAKLGGEHLITEQLLESMTITETQKELGNKEFRSQNWKAALAAYDAAIHADDGRWDVELSAQLYFNRCNVRSKLGAINGALEDVTEALTLAPFYTKAIFRRGLLYMDAEKYADALSDFQLVAQLAPDFAGLAEWLPRARNWAFRPPQKNHYSVLGIGFDATPADIKKAYRQAALRWHPDKNRNNAEQAEKMFKDIQEAFEVLSDPQRRRSYDGIDQDVSGNMGASGFPGHFGGRGRGRGYTYSTHGGGRGFAGRGRAGYSERGPHSGFTANSFFDPNWRKRSG